MYGDVLIATDGSDVAATAAQSAVTLADTLEATVHVLSVAGRRDGRSVEECERHVEAVADEARGAGCETETAVREGRPSREIIAYAREAGIDVVVLGTHGRTGIRKTLLGSVALEVIRGARLPVVTVGTDTPPLEAVETVLLATDGWGGSTAATEHALGLAAACGASLHALYAVDVDSDSERVREASEEHGDRTTASVVERAEERGLEATRTVDSGEAHEVILEHAEDDEVDLLVMGTESRSNVERLVVGSVSQRVVPHASVPVMTVRTLER